MTDEIWKPISGYEGVYEVSNLGRVRSCDRFVVCNDGRKYKRKGKVLHQSYDANKYYKVALCKNGKQKNFSVHRLVAQAFLPNPENKEQVNHKDETRTNNRVENLEWATTSENINYGTRNERVAKAVSKTKSKPVLQFTREGKFIAEFYGASEANRNTGICVSSIHRVARGVKRYKTAGGYIWKYKEEAVRS